MKLMYAGSAKGVEVRGVKFPINKPVDVKDELLAAKMLAWPDVVTVEEPVEPPKPEGTGDANQE